MHYRSFGKLDVVDRFTGEDGITTVDRSEYVEIMCAVAYHVRVRGGIETGSND